MIRQLFLHTFLLITAVLPSFSANAEQNKNPSYSVIPVLCISNDRISPEWKAALTSRMSKEELDSVSAMTRPINPGEEGWMNLIKARAGVWSRYIDSLKKPFSNCELPATLYVYMGYSGLDDAFTYQYNTVCLDLTAFQLNYGEAGLPENTNRIDRIFAHELTHLMHKDWARRHQYRAADFRDSVLWECLYEGIGMYRSLHLQWLPVNHALPQVSRTALDELIPVFVDNLIEVHTSPILDAAARKRITASLSRGRVQKKWGAFTVAIWLAMEANGDDGKLASWIDMGPEAIIGLAKKYLPDHQKEKFVPVFK